MVGFEEGGRRGSRRVAEEEAGRKRVEEAEDGGALWGSENAA